VGRGSNSISGGRGRKGDCTRISNKDQSGRAKCWKEGEKKASYDRDSQKQPQGVSKGAAMPLSLTGKGRLWGEPGQVEAFMPGV